MTQPTLIQPSELRAHNLNPIQQASLLLALNTTLCETGQVYVSFTYRNQTDASKSKPGVDYVEMPGVSPNTMIGRLIKVDRTKKEGNVYFLLECFTRGDGSSPSRPRSYRPEGVLSFVITGFTPTPAKVPEEVTA